MKRILLLCLLFLLVVPSASAEENTGYRMPPKNIADLAEIQTPSVWLSPDGKLLAITERPGLPSIKQVAQPELRLAGLRINPATNGQARTRYLNKITLKDLKSMKSISISGLPQEPAIKNLRWSPDGKTLAFTLTVDNGVQLWVADTSDGKARQLTEAVLNCTINRNPIAWLPDSRNLLIQTVIQNRGNPPQKDTTPKGPVISSNEGKKTKKAPVRTYQDLLSNQYDEDLFTYYTSSQVIKIDLAKKMTALGKPGIIRRIEPSPDGKYILVNRVKKPFSYLVPYYRFAQSVEIWDSSGKLVKIATDVPLGEDIPRGFSAVRTGPRSHSWRSDVPATLYWVEAQDGGDPGKKTAVRDKVFLQDAPFTGLPKIGPSTELRYAGIQWGNGSVAMVYEFWWRTRRQKTSLFQPDKLAKPARLLFDRSYEDRYNAPGSFAQTTNQWGHSVLLMDKRGKNLYLTGRGASPEGNRPFIDRFNIKTTKTTRLWRSKAPYYEEIDTVINISKNLVLTSREGKKIQPNYFIRNLKTGKLKAVTDFPHPFPTLKDVEKQLITFARDDGLSLKGTLYLPPGYKKSDGPLPVLMWAYPREYKSKKAAGQMTDSPYRFIRVYWSSPMIWVLQGYAVFDRVSMPIVGEGDKEPNDSFRKQLVANGKAAIEKLVAMGIADPKRIAVGGHSYGAFMTANLLAHSRLFAAGIARSGAYNRTLTPFGFQSEERTLWEAMDIYMYMSPFMHAEKVKDPLLLIHGEADNNSGTFPMQSKRYYHALKGHGAVTRLVMLPHESHGYRSRESIMHVLWETYNWLEKYVKKP